MHIKKTFLKYVTANTLTTLGIAIYTLIDTLFIINGIGTDGLTALNIILPVFNLITAISYLIAIGASTHYGIQQAQGNDEQGSLYFTNAIIAGIALSVSVALVGLLFPRSIAIFLGATDDIIPLTVDFIKIYTLFSPLIVVQAIILAFIRNDGNPRLAGISAICGTVTCILLAYIFIFKLNMGMKGVALAPGISPIIAILISFKHFIKKQNNFHFIGFTISIKHIINSMQLGFSSFISELSAGLVTYAFNHSLLSIGGNIAIASYGIIANLAIVVTSLLTGIAQGVQPLISLTFGLNQSKEMKEYIKLTIISSIAIATISFLATVLFPKEIVAIFNSENNALMASIATQGLPLYFIAFFFVGINNILMTYYASINQPQIASFLSILRGGIIIIPLVLILSAQFSLQGVWLSYPVSEVTILLIGLYLMRRISQRHRYNK